MNERFFPPPHTAPAYGLFSIRSYLLLLIVAILTPMLVLVLVIAWQYGAAARRTIEAERLDVANNLTFLIDRDIQAASGFLSGIALSPGFQADDPALLRKAVGVGTEHGFQVMGVHDRSGKLVAAAPADSEHAVADPAPLGVAEVVGGARIFVSDLVPTDNFKPGLLFVSVPVKVDGQVAFVLSGGFTPAKLQRLFAEGGQREGWGAGIVDRKGILIARNERPDLWVGKPAQQPMVDAARGNRSSGLFDVVSRDGIDIKNAFQRSTITGWTVGVAVPSAVVNAPLWHNALLMATIGVCLTVIALLLGSIVAGRIARAVHQLGYASVAFASGHDVPLPGHMLTELQDVSQALQAAAAAARQRAATERR